MKSLLRKLSNAVPEGMLLSGHPGVEELDLERDYPEIDKLFEREEWPFLRSDLEISNQQPLAAAFVAHKHGKFAGFFTTHHFGLVGYLDMMIVAPEFRNVAVARPLYLKTMNVLKRRGLTSFVVHTTNESAGLIKLLGFRGGQTFTLLRREPRESTRETATANEVTRLGPEDLKEIVRLDSEVFGMARETWIMPLLAQPSTEFFGLKRHGVLAASVCVRARRNNAIALDATNALDFRDLERVVVEVIGVHADRRIECFVRTDSELHRLLETLAFTVPEFFKAIGPLIEWRKGETGAVGTSERVQCLAWF